MILQALYQLAQTEKLAEDLDFQMVPVAYGIALGKGPASLIPRLDSPSGGKGKPKAAPMSIPRQEGRTSGDKAYFLVDKADYVFGWDPSGKQTTAKLKKRLALFRQRVEQASHYESISPLEEQALQAVLAFLDLPEEQRIAPLLAQLGSTPSEATRKDLGASLFAFRFTPAGPDPIHLLGGIQAFWRTQRERKPGKAPVICLVTGQPCEPMDVHPPVKGVPGGNTSGAALISFNCSAFESYGLSNNANAPIGRIASETCAAALNRLLAAAPIHPDNHPLPRRNLRISDDTAALFWNADNNEGLDWLLELNGEDPESIRLALESPMAGRPAPLRDPSRFYTLLLSGAQGRSIVRNFLDSNTQKVAMAVQRFLDDVCIEKAYGKGTGAYPLWAMLRSLAVLGKTENLPPNLASEVYLAAILDRALPPMVLSAALRRNRAEGPAKEGFAPRCALIRASLIRQNYPQRKEIRVSLDPNCHEIGYLLGRLLAVLDKAQSLAIPGANATVVDRYYGTASTAPATVFPVLLQKGQQHLSKLRGDKERPWAFPLVEKALSEVTERMEATPFPKVLDLPSQGLFALGFHHQRQSFFIKKEASPAANA